MIVKAIIVRIKTQQTNITRVLPIGDATDTNIGQGTDPYILVGELESRIDSDVTRIRVRTCYPKGYSAFLDEFVTYTLRNMFDGAELTIKNRLDVTTAITFSTVEKSLSGTGYTEDGYIYRDRIITVPCLEQ